MFDSFIRDLGPVDVHVRCDREGVHSDLTTGAAALRDAHDKLRDLQSQLDRAEWGCLVAKLLLKYPWLQSFKIECFGEMVLSDEGDMYMSSSTHVVDARWNAELLPSEDCDFAADDLEWQDPESDAVADALAEHLEETIDHESPSSLFDLLDNGPYGDLRTGREPGPVPDHQYELAVDRASLAECLSQKLVSGLAVFDSVVRRSKALANGR